MAILFNSKRAGGGLRRGLLGLLCCFGWPVLADTPVDSTIRTRVLVVSEPPEVDGKLDEDFWQHAERLQPLTQVIPLPGASPSQRTDIRIVRTDRSLYFGVRCYDDDPEKIVAQVMEQGIPLDGDDRIGIALDTFRNERSGFVFYVNPRGARFEALIEFNNTVEDWSTIWQAAGSIDSEGWVAEVEIPFESISFNSEDDVWGMNFLRVIRRTNEELRWADIDINRQFTNMSEGGELGGMLGANQGIGLDVIPILSVRRVDDNRIDGHGFEATPGGEVFYRPAPEVTVALAGNADFGDTESDEFQLNSTRYSVFYPEKRALFLQDANIFEFGVGGEFEGAYGATNGRPFFSRRIGNWELGRFGPDGGYQVDSQEVPLLLAGKVTGRVGRVNFGVMEAWTDSGDGVGQKNLGVGRVSVNVGRESRVGVIATHGNAWEDPYYTQHKAKPDPSNALVGIDGVYRTSQWGDGKILEAGGWYQRSFTEGWSGSQTALGGMVRYPNDRFNWQVSYKELSQDFHPGLGYVDEVGVRRYQSNFRYRVRPDWMRTVDFGFWSSVTTDRDNNLQRTFTGISPLWLTNAIGDGIWLGYSFDIERWGWAIPYSGIEMRTIPGGYKNHGMFLEMYSSPARPLSFYFYGEAAQCFGGTCVSVRPSISYQPSRHLKFWIQYAGWYIDDVNSVTAKTSWKNHVASGRVDVMFTVDLVWNTLVQWRDDTNQILVDSRLRWIVVPGRELALVLKQELRSGRQGLRLERSEAPIAKIRWTFRF